MSVDSKVPMRTLLPGLPLLPGETIEFSVQTCAVKLFEATGDGAFAECGGKVGNYYSASNEASVIITNHRTCFQLLRSSANSKARSDMTLSDACTPIVQIPHLSISQLDSLPTQITISLKFSPMKYLTKFSKPRRPLLLHIGRKKPTRFETAAELCDGFCAQLKKFCCPANIEQVFAFRMGEAILTKSENQDSTLQVTNGSNSRRPTLEEQIFEELFGGFNSEDDDVDEVDEVGSKGIDRRMYKCMQTLGWTKGYKILREFERMRISKETWSIASINENFTLSPTYPTDFILPSQILKSADTFQDSTGGNASAFLTNLARFRSRARFPVICWKRNQHVLMRSGQPMVGFLGSRGYEDELLMREVFRAVNEEQGVGPRRGHATHMVETRRSKPAGLHGKSTMKICFLDARGYASAFSNGYSGGGYENTENYPPGTTLDFLSLPNIHSISSSHQSLLRAISANASSPNWFSVLESTGWLGLVADLLKAAGGKDGVIGKIVDENASVLVHCSDGWDRTTQLVSLAQIMLDPFYRTIKGLRVLIEKEWIAFGHPFRARCDLPLTLRNNATRSPMVYGETTRQLRTCVEPTPLESPPAPVFLLFLTCVHHLLEQFPESFEYNDFLLLCLARAAAGNSPFGDFLCNSECERENIQLRERTQTIWAWVKERRRWFRNAAYQGGRKHDHVPGDDTWRKDVLRPDTSARWITLWTDYYFPKDDLSIALLCTPSGEDFVIPSSAALTPHQYHPCTISGLPSEYYLVSLFVRRRRRRIAQKVWRTWRSLVIDKKKLRQELLHASNRPMNEPDDKWNVEEIEVASMCSLWQDNKDETGGVDQEHNASHVFLINPPLKRVPSLTEDDLTPEVPSSSMPSHGTLAPASRPTMSRSISVSSSTSDSVRYFAKGEWIEVSCNDDHSPTASGECLSLTELLRQAQDDDMRPANITVSNTSSVHSARPRFTIASTTGVVRTFSDTADRLPVDTLATGNCGDGEFVIV